MPRPKTGVTRPGAKVPRLPVALAVGATHPGPAPRPPRYNPSTGVSYDVAHTLWGSTSATPAVTAVDLRGNCSAVGGVKPIRPTSFPLPSRHRAFQEFMQTLINGNTTASATAVGKVALVTLRHDDTLLTESQWACVTHYVMTQ